MESNEEKIKDLKSIYMNRRGRHWEDYLSKYHCDTICEIGVREGMNFKDMIKHQPKLAVAIDCWVDDGVLARNDCCFSQDILDKQYETFKSEMADKPFVKIYRNYSTDVVKEFPDEYFDFIFIDADHTYEGVKRDLADWYPKVKKGGVFCGHDYSNRVARTKRGKFSFGVIQAVDEFVKERNLSTFFTLSYSIWGIIK